ncbi:MAG: dihydrolipoamide acetyltransferase family protein [Actinomycetota bacterium]
MRTFVLPDLGEGLHEAEIVTWHVSPGDSVVADQPLVAVETDKAVVEIPAPWSGRIARLHGEPGQIVETGQPLVDFDDGPAPDFNGIVGELPAAEPVAEPAVARSATPAPRPPVRAGGIVQAPPAVRALAKRLGVDLAEVEPTGPGGLATAADVERAAQAPAQDVAYEPLRGPRRAMAESMTRSGAEVVPATLTDEADVDAWAPGTRATLRLVRAIVAGCRAEPALNAWLATGAAGRRVHQQVDLGVAVDSPDGLFVPVLRGADRLAPDAVAARLDELIAAVRDRSIPVEDLRGATITLSNFGSLGGRHAVLVVVPPQVAILGAGRAAPRVVAVDGQPAVHRILPVSLTVDHRAVAGGEAARFLAAVVADLERAD